MEIAAYVLVACLVVGGLVWLRRRASRTSDRFEADAKQALISARLEVWRLKCERLGSEHILLGLLRGRNPATEALRRMGFDPNRIGAEVEQRVEPGLAADARERVDFTASAQSALELAMQEAKSLGLSRIGAAHLLLGLIRAREGVAGKILARFGVDLDAAREQLGGS